MTSARRERPRRRRRWRVLLLLVLLLGLAVWVASLWRRHVRAVRVAELTVTRDALKEQLAVLSARDPVLATLPDDDVLVGIPRRFAREALRQVAVGYLGHVEVALRDLRIHKSGSVSTKILFGHVTPGLYSLDLRIHEINGELEALRPKTHLHGQRIEVDMPVRIARGEGRATLVFDWDSRGLAGAVCGDFRATVPLAGKVVPRTYRAHGWIDVALDGETVTATPVFPGLVVNLRVEPSAATWAALEKVLGKQSAGCRTALKLVDHHALIEELLAKGFDVKVPQEIFQPMRRDLAFTRTVKLGGRDTLVRVLPRSLTAAPGYLWYGATVQLEYAAPNEGGGE